MAATPHHRHHHPSLLLSDVPNSGETGEAGQTGEQRVAQLLTSRIEELEASVVSQRMSIEASRGREVQLHATIAGLQEVLTRCRVRADEVEAELLRHREREAELTERVHALLSENHNFRSRVLELSFSAGSTPSAEIVGAAVPPGGRSDAWPGVALQTEAQRTEPCDRDPRRSIASEGSSSFSHSQATAKPSPPFASASAREHVQQREVHAAVLESISTRLLGEVTQLSTEELRCRLAATTQSLHEAHGIIASLLGVAGGRRHGPRADQAQNLCQQRPLMKGEPDPQDPLHHSAACSGIFSAASSSSLGALRSGGSWRGAPSGAAGSKVAAATAGTTTTTTTIFGIDSPFRRDASERGRGWLIRENAALSLRVGELERQLQLQQLSI